MASVGDSVMMMRPIAVLVLALSLLGAAPGQRGASQTGRHDLVGREIDAVVTRVGDADTLDARVAGESQPIRVRLQGIDAPEQGEVFSREALALLRTLVFDQRVRVIGRDVDRYGRLIARVVKDGVDASVHLVRAGLACHAYAYDAVLAREEAQARQSGAGFWAAPAKPACVTQTSFSRKQRAGGAGVSSTAPPATAAAPVFQGNTSSRVYHAPHCRNYNCRNCTRIFGSHAEAQAAGFRPARDCMKS